MPDRPRLFETFRKEWPIDKLSRMDLNSYTRFGSKESFTYWVEHKVDMLGSIRGNPGFKFGIFARDPGKEQSKQNKYRYDNKYAWLAKLGSTANEAYATILDRILTLVKAAQTGDLETVDQVELSHMFKWKLAFLYQPDLLKPMVMNIFKKEALEYLADSLGPIPELQKRILSAMPAGMDFFTFGDEQYERFNNRSVKVVASRETDTGNEQAILNSIFYGPPGTGKTWQILRFLETLKRPVTPPVPGKELDVNRTFWHLAPGLGGSLWNVLRQGDRLGYQWCARNLGDLSNLSMDAPHSAIIRRFAQVQQGDYIAVISGLKLLALAEVREGYGFPRADHQAFPFQTLAVRWIEQFDQPILLNTTQTMTFCRLNDGNRWSALQEGLEERGYRFREGLGKGTLPPTEKRSHLLVTFHQSYSYEDFIEGIKPVMDETDDEPDSGSVNYRIEPGVFYQACNYAAQRAGYTDLAAALQDSKENRQERFKEAEPFYLVIDEINRGNVANIFGELITLVEADKRLGADNEVIVGLPYSKAPFGVPLNLHLIGTMNTADRSVEALDSALRRRFSFRECAPDPTAINNPEGLDVDVRRLLIALNSRIEQVLDKDHRIGHAYFTNLESTAEPFESLRQVFTNKIIPQLEEYCFGAPEKLHRILGPDFVSQVAPEYPVFGENEMEQSQVWRTHVPDNLEAFTKYYSTSGAQD